MTWEDHISSIVNKINQLLDVLRRLKQMLPLQSRLTLYNSLVFPLFYYSDIVAPLPWKIFRFFKTKLLRFSASEALDSHGWKPLHLRQHFHRCTTIFKCLNGFIDFHFHFVKNNTVHNFNTRFRHDFHLPHVKTTFYVSERRRLELFKSGYMWHLYVFLFEI